MSHIDDEKAMYGAKGSQVPQGEDASVAVLPAEGIDDTAVDVHTHLYDGVQRRMEQRHMQMIALAGTLGTGLFLGSGKAIVHGGPAGALLAYIHVGTIAYAMLVSLGEMAVYAPISGGYIHFAERWLNPAAGFALGYQVVFSGIISLPTEIISASILISFWDPAFPISHQAAYITALMIVCALVNYLGVRWFGESEFIFAMIKITLIVGLIIAGLVVDLGGGPNGDRIGFRYWKHPGAFAEYHTTGSTGKFLGWFTDLLQAAYSYLGMEQIAVAAAEVKNPRIAVAKACRRIFYRIALFYIIGILIIGMLVPSDSQDLLQSTGTTAASSPFVLAFNLAGIKVLPSIINAGVLTSAFSAANSGLYGSSRMLYGLALRGQAPRIFARTTSKGLPIFSLMLVTVFMALSYMALGSGAQTALNWLSNLTSLGGFITWCTICVTYLRFRAGIKAQGIDSSKFHYRGPFQPYAAYWCIFWCCIVIVFNGWEVFTHGGWNSSDFVVAYINLPLFFLLIGGFLIIKKPTHLKPIEMDFYSNIPTDEEVSYEEPPPKTIFHKIANYIFT
ncbi:amino acid permease/ SLC12A domain-containing protein [Naematelia encephala]|uniref:Amino acid permease/ SLC12A domain-containing protein n=1 Tax=Naematelia encephala TaxID=71784 RepID=A0A1Y2AS12_9TREE|nr:amino acid permease/ SLC12A domain-containing protein [Naematelia encephala]